MGTPSKVRSRVAGHIQRRVFFCQACGSPFLRRYIPSYASIAAIYRCKKERILFFLAKKYPNACICAIFVVSLQPETNERPYETNPIIGMYDDVPIDCLSASKPDSRRLEDRGRQDRRTPLGSTHLQGYRRTLLRQDRPTAGR